ncbi:MAG: RNA-directed DNA polymerase [Burkholderiales bacterium]
MPRFHDDLFDQIAAFQPLCEATRRAAKGKRGKPGCAMFLNNLERNVLRLERELQDGTWRPGAYTVIDVRDPKPRRVSAAPFRDRVVHHALCRVVQPIFERGFIDDTYANRVGKGTHRAVDRYERFSATRRHVLRADIFRFFPSIDHEILKGLFRRRIACSRTLALMDAIVDGSNPQEPVLRYFAGDDLFTPHERRRGLPIGNLTSQFFGNLMLDALDHFVKEVLRVRGYVRYVDDFALFHDDAEYLEACRSRIARHLEGRRMLLHPRKTFIEVTASPARFLGYELHPGGFRRLPADNVDRFAGRLRSLRARFRNGDIGFEAIAPRIRAWNAHAAHANTWRLRASLFRGGVFSRSREPDRFL